jgi:hypothetical protein
MLCSGDGDGYISRVRSQSRVGWMCVVWKDEKGVWGVWNERERQYPLIVLLSREWSRSSRGAIYYMVCMCAKELLAESKRVVSATVARTPTGRRSLWR